MDCEDPRYIIVEIQIEMNKVVPRKESLWKRFDSWLCSLDKPWIDAILEWGDRLFKRLLHFENFLWNVIFTYDFLNLRVLRLLWDYREIPIWRHKPKEGISRGWWQFHDFTGKGLHISIQKSIPKVMAITILLHELGHHEDLGSGLHRHYGGHRRHEKAAWSQAIRLSEKYGLPLDAGFAKECLKKYGFTHARLENLITLSKVC